MLMNVRLSSTKKRSESGLCLFILRLFLTGVSLLPLRACGINPPRSKKVYHQLRDCYDIVPLSIAYFSATLEDIEEQAALRKDRQSAMSRLATVGCLAACAILVRAHEELQLKLSGTPKRNAKLRATKVRVPI